MNFSILDLKTTLKDNFSSESCSPSRDAISNDGNKTTQVYEGNHRMAALLDNNVDWVPLMVNYFFLTDDDDTRFCLVPQTVNGNWPSNPKPSNFDFETRLI